MRVKLIENKQPLFSFACLLFQVLIFMEPRPPTADEYSGRGVEGLRKKLKQLETNHKEWQDQVQKDLRRQKMELETLRRDNEQYKQQLNELRATEATTSMGTGSLRNPNSSGTRRSKELDAKRDMLSHLEMRVQNETAKIEEMKRQVEDTRSQIRLARKDMGGVNVTQESHELINRQVHVLENRLDQSLVKFNEVLRQNKDLREQIDTLRGERDVFESIYQKLEAELQEKKKEMAFIIEVSNIAYEERDNNVQVLQNLKAFAAEEMNSFAETFRELDELLEEDRKMKEQVKSRIAVLEKKERANEGREEVKRRAAQHKQAPVAEQATREATQTQAQAYEEAFLKIRQATDIPDLNDIVQRFLNAEEDNFSLFSYVNDLSKEIEALEKQRSELMDEIDHLSLGDAEDQERREKLKVLEDKLRAEEQRNRAFIEKSLNTESVLRGVMTMVENIFGKLDCDDSIIVEQHGISGLTLENLLLYLAAIELRTDEYLVSWSKQNGALTDGMVGPRGPQVPYDSMQVTVDHKKLPNTSEDADNNEEEDRPLSREELQKRVLEKLSKQEKSIDGRITRGKAKVIGLGPSKK